MRLITCAIKIFGCKFNVSGPLLKEKALKFASELGVESFKASNRRLDHS